MKHFRWFTEHPGISKEALGSMLRMQRGFMPDSNLPDSYEAALQAIEPYLVDTIVYDVCTNDCIVFRKEHAESAQCPKCGSNRYIAPGSEVAVRKFTYLPLKPRLARLFGTASTAAVLQAHATAERGAKVYDIQQSSAWDAAYGQDGVFGRDPRGISLALCTDGVNPWAHNKVTYVTGFGKTLHKAGEHVLMYMLIKINISINMYTKVIFKTPITLEWNRAWLWFRYYSILWNKPFNVVPKSQCSFVEGFPKTGHIFHVAHHAHTAKSAQAFTKSLF